MTNDEIRLLRQASLGLLNGPQRFVMTNDALLLLVDHVANRLTKEPAGRHAAVLQLMSTQAGALFAAASRNGSTIQYNGLAVSIITEEQVRAALEEICPPGPQG